MGLEDETYESIRSENVFQYARHRGYYTRAQRSQFHVDLDAGNLEGLEQGHAVYSAFTTGLPLAGIGMGLIGVMCALTKQEIGPLNFGAACFATSIGTAVAYHFIDLATHTYLQSRERR